MPDIIFSSAIDYALGWAVLHSIWQITLIAIATGIVLFAMRYRTAQARYWVANAALLAVLIATVGTFVWYKSSSDFEKEQVSKQLEAAKPTASLLLEKNNANVTEIPSTPITSPKGNFTSDFRDYFERNLPMVILIWLLGLAIGFFRMMSQVSYVYYLRQRMNFHADPYWSAILARLVERSGFSKSIELLESALVRSPLTIGHLKPVILFPIGIINRLSEQETEAILAHELAHIMRRDYLFNVLQSVVEAIFYYHPAVWWLSEQVRNERESACDDMAIALLGNKLNYAKALVTIQEMAFYPLSPALGFAGQRQNQLLIRLQRLLSPPKFKFNTMEKWITTVLVVCSIVVLALGQRIQNYTNGNGFTTNEALTASSGIWEATFKKDSVYLSFSQRSHNSHWSSSDIYPRSAFTGLTDAPGDTEFRMTRPAGVMAFRGKIEGDGGYGRFEFTADEAFKKGLDDNGIKNADEDLMMHCFFANFQSDYLAYMQKKGFGKIDKDELTELAVFRLNPETVNQYLELSSKLGKKEIDIDDLVELRVANVTPERVAEFAKSGYPNMGLSEISQFSLHQIDPAFIEQMNAQGFGKLDADDMMAAKIHGITPEFVGQCKKLGLGNLKFEDILSMKIHDISPEFVNQAKNAGLGNLDFDDITAMKIHGITPEFVQQSKALGLGNLGFDDITAMKIHNISPEFVQQCKTLGLGDLSFDDITAMKIHNITPEFISQCKGMNLGNLSYDDIVSMKIHNISPEFVQQCQATGLKGLDFEDIMAMKIHNLDADFIKKCQGMGLGNLDLDDMMALKIHNIDAGFIQKAKNMGFEDLELDDIMSMKIHGITAEYLEQCKKSDLGKLNLDDVMSLKIHNVTPEFVQSFRNQNIKNITADAIVAAKIHGLTADYIKEAEKKGYRFPSLEEYVDLKVRKQYRTRE